MTFKVIVSVCVVFVSAFCMPGIPYHETLGTFSAFCCSKHQIFIADFKDNYLEIGVVVKIAAELTCLDH